MTANRISSLHVLRGLAALQVAFGHAYYFAFDPSIQSQFFGQTLVNLSPEIGAPAKLYPFMPSGNLPVAAFFLLSGFVLEGSLKRLSPVSFLINRTLRIYPVFIVAFFAHLCLIATLGGLVPSVTLIWRNFLLIDSVAVMPISWTLLFEVRYYILVAALCAVRLPPQLRYWAILAVFVWVGDGLTFWLSFMTMGAIAAAFVEGKKTDTAARAAISLLAYVLIWLFVAISIHDLPQKLNVPTTEILGSMLALAAAISLFNIDIRSRTLNFLGDISYPLYCLHHPVVIAMHYLLIGKVPTSIIPPIALVLSIIVAWFVHVLVEKPGMHRSSQLRSDTLTTLPTRILRAIRAGFMATDKGGSPK
jgi:peptidoglycan/LPS O-acetylase OafA/YrhL